MTRDEWDALPVGARLSTTSACPACGIRDVELHIVLLAAPIGQFSLAGVQSRSASF
jgi:hypothetical protein